MSRRNRAPKRTILPDPIYNSELVAKFVNNLMLDGKKSIAERIVYGALEQALEKLKRSQGKDEGDSGDSSGGRRVSSVPDVLALAISSVRPAVEVKSRRVGGSTYQVPVEVNDTRGRSLAMRWIIDSARKRSEKSMLNQLSAEIVDACHHRGAAFKKKIDTHKMADANKAFAHFRW